MTDLAKLKPIFGTTTVYVSIGNTDGKLNQPEYAEYVRDFRRVMGKYAVETYGVWFSAPDVPFQNACIAIGVKADLVDELRDELSKMRSYFEQDSVAWAVVPTTEFI